MINLKIFAILLLTAAASISMERVNNNSSEYGVYNGNIGLKIGYCKDTTNDSASFTLSAQGEFKKRSLENLQAIRQEFEINNHDHSKVRRFLSLDGGGIRGIFSVMQLCVLEEIINLPENADLKANFGVDKDAYIYIHDIFDLGAGTSTGSILTAAFFAKQGYFGAPGYTATDIAKLYVRYGYKIFNEQKNSIAKMGVTEATYKSKGLEDLLSLHFGNSALNNVHKPVYIVALNETRLEAAIIASEPVYTLKEKLENIQLDYHTTPMVDAVVCSSSAPCFFPAKNLKTGIGQNLMSDGGTVANNPSYLVYSEQIKKYANAFEIYSFGTGVAPITKIRPENTGAAYIKEYFDNTLTAAEKLALHYLLGEIEKPSSQLSYVARMNPLIEAGMEEKLDDTSEYFVDYAMEKALAVTQEGAFANMVQQLGFSMPNDLSNVHDRVKKKLSALNQNKYFDLSTLEKEFIIKKLLDLDFKLYQDRFFINPHNPNNLIQMTESEVGNFLTEMLQDISARIEEKDSFVTRLWSFISTSGEEKILDFIPRCTSFHGLSDNALTLTKQDLDILTSNVKEFTQEQLLKLSPNHRIRGTGVLYRWGSASELSLENDLASKLFLKYIELCDTSTEIAFDYSDAKKPFLSLTALIFWKDAFKNIEGILTEETLQTLKNNLKSHIEQIKASRSYSVYTGNLRNLRFEILVDALDTYIEKFVRK